MKSYHIEDRDVTCPWCSKQLDGVTEAHGQPGGPEPGALSICIYCAGYMVMQDGHILYKKLTDEDVKALSKKNQEKLAMYRNFILEQQNRRAN